MSISVLWIFFSSTDCTDQRIFWCLIGSRPTGPNSTYSIQFIFASPKITNYKFGIVKEAGPMHHMRLTQILMDNLSNWKVWSVQWFSNFLGVKDLHFIRCCFKEWKEGDFVCFLWLRPTLFCADGFICSKASQWWKWGGGGSLSLSPPRCILLVQERKQVLWCSVHGWVALSKCGLAVNTWISDN